MVSLPVIFFSKEPTTKVLLLKTDDGMSTVLAIFYVHCNQYQQHSNLLTNHRCAFWARLAEMLMSISAITFGRYNYKCKKLHFKRISALQSQPYSFCVIYVYKYRDDDIISTLYDYRIYNCYSHGVRMVIGEGRTEYRHFLSLSCLVLSCLMPSLQE